MICACGAEFAPHKNHKTCSLECSRKRKALREREYNATHPKVRARMQSRRNDVIKFVRAKRFSRRLDRAVHILFNLTGDAL